MEVSKQTSTKQERKKRKPRVDLSTMVCGKVPPQARDLEDAVLGALMLDKSAYDPVRDILTHDCFYVDANQRIFKAIQSLVMHNDPADMLMVVQELIRTEELDMVGGPYYITRLTNAVVSGVNIEAHARIIKQKFIQRELIRIGGEMISEAYENSSDVFDLLETAEKAISDIALSTSKRSYKRMDNVIDRLLNHVEGLRARNENITGVPTGIMRLDTVTGGWQPTDLIIIAARPSIGKSAIAGNLARNAALHPDKPMGVGIFSLEMSDMQWALRLLAAESEIDGWKINRAKLSDEEMMKLHDVGARKLAPAQIFIDDTPGINIYEFRSKVRKLVIQEKVGLIIVDYLQLMSGTNERQQNREQEISTISRNLKALAKELYIPIIALSQLSRDVEKRGGKPVLSNLRESGAIEQDADMVMFLVPVEDDDVAKDASLRDSIHIRIAKHRQGALEDIEVKFVKDIQKIMSRSDYEDYKVRTGMASRGFVPIQTLDFSQSNNSQSEEAGDDLPF